MIDDVVGTYELSSCYNVTIDCRAAEMIATVRTNKVFNGKIYAKDNPNSCVVDVDNGIEFQIAMGYNDIECNVKRKGQVSVAVFCLCILSFQRAYLTPQNRACTPTR